MRIRLIASTALLLCLAAGAFALPQQFPKLAGWSTYLVTNDGVGLKDTDFVQIVKNTRNGLNGTRRFDFIASFTQCFGGGFADELGNAAIGLDRYGANSASAYFEPASYDPGNPPNMPSVGSYYDFAWKTTADGNAGQTDEWITGTAADAIDRNTGPVAGITKNPHSDVERPQYRSDRVAGGPPKPLGGMAAMHKYAILFVGQPQSTGQDYKDLNDIYGTLRNRGFAAADILILWGDKTDPNRNDAWVPDRAANTADIQWAFDQVKARINGQVNANDTNQVFFWAGDHGNADAPITITVDGASQGVPGTGVAWAQAQGTAGDTIYVAGGNNNWDLLVEKTAGGRLKALSFGDDFRDPRLFQSYYASASAILYFGVDNPSAGAAGSEVAAENAKLPARRAGADVYVWTQNSNRQMFDGRRLGLLKGNPNDELNDFVLRDIRQMLVNGLPARPVFFTTAADSRIWVYDPNFPNSYVYYDFNKNWPGMPPRLVDALAMVVNLTRRDNLGKLYPDWTQDYMLFSVGRGEAVMPWMGYRPCDILRFGLGRPLDVFASCAQLGLMVNDNVDGLDVGAGATGEPINFSQEQSWPNPYPNGGNPPPGVPMPGSKPAP
jgi:hypothetical protein